MATLTINAQSGLTWRTGWPGGWVEAWPRQDSCRPAKRRAEPGVEPDDATWITRVLEGDESAARALVERLCPLVMKIVRGRLPRRTQEEDLAQAIFFKIFKSLAQFSGRVPLEHWVSRIAINTCINQLKHEAGRPELRMSDLSEEQEAIVGHLACTDAELPTERSRAARELLNELFSRLPHEDRLVLTLLHLDERSVAEISRITGWAASRIKVKAFRARHKLRHVWNSLVRQGRYSRD